MQKSRQGKDVDLGRDLMGGGSKQNVAWSTLCFLPARIRIIQAGRESKNSVCGFVGGCVRLYLLILL